VSAPLDPIGNGGDNAKKGNNKPFNRKPKGQINNHPLNGGNNQNQGLDGKVQYSTRPSYDAYFRRLVYLEHIRFSLL